MGVMEPEHGRGHHHEMRQTENFRLPPQEEQRSAEEKGDAEQDPPRFGYGQQNEDAKKEISGPAMGAVGHHGQSVGRRRKGQPDHDLVDAALQRKPRWVEGATG